MTVRRTLPARLTVVAVGCLAVIQLTAALMSPDGAVVSTSALLGALNLLACVALARDDSFEARLAVVVLGCAQLGLLTLQSTIGLPGQPPGPFGPRAGLTLVATAGVLALLAVDHRTRRRCSPQDGGTPPYAL